MSTMYPWAVTATTKRGKSFTQRAATRARARTLRANLSRAPFVDSVSAPYNELTK